MAKKQQKQEKIDKTFTLKFDASKKQMFNFELNNIALSEVLGLIDLFKFDIMKRNVK